APPPSLINADRPGIADGSNVIGPRRFQIEIGGQWERHDSDGAKDRRFLGPSLLRFGISNQWEMRIETPAAYAFADADGQRNVGYSPTSLGT
ncbi:hypothetical protein ABTK87_19340, partial [Acinetobacter baumannii]